MITDNKKLRFSLFWIVLGLFPILLVFINPLRETPTADDWSYALTVKHLLETGTYRLNDWAVANFPFQAYWGAFFSKLFGYSFITLRFSTVIQAFMALIAFYFLAKEHDLKETQASLLTLALLACPLFLLFSVSFMTDVPFFAWSILTLLLFTKAVRKKSYALVFTGSLACAAAILIRQFGLALLIGFAAAVFFQREQRKRVLFLFAGSFFPILGVLIQFSAGLISPTWGAQVRMQEQSEYFHQGIFLLLDMLWRIAVLIQYVVLFAAPFTLMALFVFFVRKNKAEKPHIFRHPTAIISVSLFLLASMVYGHYKLGISWYMPYLPFYLTALSKGVLGPLTTLVALVGGVVCSCFVMSRYFDFPGWREIPPHQRLLDLATLCFVVLQLIYVQFADRYLLVFLPFLLIVIGRHLAPWLARNQVPAVLLCVLLIIPSTLWTRGWLSYQEAGWKGGEMLRLRGIAPAKIFGSWEWICYYTFGNYIDQHKNTKPSMDDLYHGWLDGKKLSAEYLVLDKKNENGWQVLAEIPYRNSFFRQKKFFVMARKSDKQH